MMSNVDLDALRAFAESIDTMVLRLAQADGFQVEQYTGSRAGDAMRKAADELTRLRAFRDAVESAPTGTCTSFDTAGAWMIDKDDRRGVYPPLRHKRVRLVHVDTEREN